MIRVKLVEIVKELESGSRPKGGVSVDTGSIPSLGAEHLADDGGFNFHKNKFISEAFFRSLKSGVIKSNDILIVKDGATTGKVSYVQTDFPFERAAINEHVFRVAIDERKGFPKFVYYFLRSSDGKKQILNDFRGATVGGISRQFIESTKIPLPPLDDQIRIAIVLTRAERLIAKRKESIKALDELLKGAFLEMFGDSCQFEWKPIEQIADKKKKYSVSSGPFGSNLTSKHYTNSGIVILRGTNISSGKLRLDDVKYISEEKAIELKRSELHAGDVVIIAVGSSGQALKIPNGVPKMIMSQNFNKITPDVSIINPTYLEHCINGKYVQGQFKKQITDTVRTFLSLTKIISISIPIPPLPLQNQFAAIVEKVESIKSKQAQSLAELENFYASLSQRAFKGELGLSRVPVVYVEAEPLETKSTISADVNVMKVFSKAVIPE